jgi:hypothetical protein
MKEHVKTAALILLSLSAAFLVYRTWIADSGLFGGEAQGLPVFARERLDYTPSAARPAACAVMRSGERTGTQYDEETGHVYELFKFLLAGAFSTAANAEQVENTWTQREILSRDGVYFKFSGHFPLPLIAAWLSADVPALPAAAGGVEAVGLVFDGSSVQVYWIYTTGDFWLAESDAIFEEWPDMPEMRLCAFAFETAYTDVWRLRQLLIEEALPRASVILSVPPGIRQGDSVYAPFLVNLDLASSGATFYDRDDGRVYVDVESGRSCIFSDDGAIRFSSPAAVPPAASADAGIAADVLRAWEALSLLEPVTGSARFEVYRVTREGGTTIIEFLLVTGGVPVLWEPAMVEVRNGVIGQISLTLRFVEAGDSAAAPLPLRQAAALAPHGGTARLDLRYVPGGEAAEIMWVVSE